ncbi:MAG: molybdopterin cofactor-binding domain-containing protein, partial [Dehalococcoidia bacterium]
MANDDMTQPTKQTPRVDGLGKVTGSSVYTADVAIPQALWAKVLRSPHPHARILRIDATKARAVPGVRAVITGDDVSDTLYGRKLKDLPVLAKGVVRFIGEQVAAVAADDKETAERAAQLIEVDYEPLTPVFDPVEAAADKGVIVHPEVHLYEGLHHPLDGPSNVFTRNEWGRGDVDAGLASADLVVENTFSTSTMHQGYMETNNWLVWVDPDGRVQVWASNKTPYPTRQQISAAIETPVEQILF